jgi:transposase
MNALAGAHDAAVQMIDTSIIRVHPHGACITRNRRQSMGRSRGGLTSKIHAVVDTNGLPVRLALTAREAHDNRLAGKLLSRLKSGTMLLADRGYDADWIRALAANRGVWANIPPRSNRNEPICLAASPTINWPTSRSHGDSGLGMEQAEILMACLNGRPVHRGLRSASGLLPCHSGSYTELYGIRRES